jgi:hypothetical protein
LEEKTATLCFSNSGRARKYGPAISTPRVLASSLLEIMHPSLLLNTTTGLLTRPGLNNLSQEQ